MRVIKKEWKAALLSADGAVALAGYVMLGFGKI